MGILIYLLAAILLVGGMVFLVRARGVAMANDPALRRARQIAGTGFALAGAALALYALAQRNGGA